MKNHRLVIASLSMALAAGFASQASAQASGLVASPATVNIAARGGDLAYQWVTITNKGPGFASNLSALIGPSNGGHYSGLDINQDTCTGATLAQNGTCSIRLELDAGCFKKTGPGDTWYLTVSSAQLPQLNVKVVGNILSYSCD